MPDRRLYAAMAVLNIDGPCIAEIPPMAAPETRYWIGVASRDHVARGVAGGFCQLGHGKASAVGA